MNNFRNRPNGDYIFNADWDELFVLTEYWKSDLLFYKDDSMFLDELINKYILWISKDEDLEKVRVIKKSVVETTNKCLKLLERVQKHLIHLTNLIDNPFPYDTQKFREEHQQLEDDFTEFLKAFRNNRKEVFKVTKYLLERDEFIRTLVKASL